MLTKFVFNNETFDEYSDAENAVIEYVYLNIDDFIDDCYGEVNIAGNLFRTSIALRQTDPILFSMIRDDYIQFFLKDIEEIEYEDEEDEEGNDGTVVSSSEEI